MPSSHERYNACFEGTAQCWCVCWDAMSSGFILQNFNLRLRLKRLVHSGDKTFEAEPLAVDVLHRSKRPFEESCDGVAEETIIMAICLELEMASRQELLDLRHQHGPCLLP